MRYMRNISVLCALVLLSCQGKVKEQPTLAAPPPTYQGPAFLHGSLGSLAVVKGNQPTLVSGYGLVVGLNGTGSPDCPPALRQWLFNEMRKGGFGSARLGLQDRPPEVELASGRVAVVMIEGLIPAGASRGTRFDVRVSALPQSSTTSLEDGRLYTADLKLAGLDPAMADTSSINALATAGGPVFINPFLDISSETDSLNDPRRIGAVLAGGHTLRDQPVELVLTRPSLRMVKQIAERINQVIRPDKSDHGAVAVEISESTIRLNPPVRYGSNPQRLLDLISHIFLDPQPIFASRKAEELAAILDDPEQQRYADDVALTWEAMGRAVWPVIRRYYQDSNTIRRHVALQAGARQGDTRTLDPLWYVAQNDGDMKRVEQAVALIGELLLTRPQRSDPAIVGKLRLMLDHEDLYVRLAAFEALSAAGDATIERRSFDQKLELVRVRCNKPFIFVSRSGLPRIVFFGPQPLASPMLFSLWEDRLMLRTGLDDPNLHIFYRDPQARQPLKKSIPADAYFLTGTLAFRPLRDSPTFGLDFSYSRIVTVLNKLISDKHLASPLVLQQDDLADRIQRRRIYQGQSDRPDTSLGDPENPQSLRTIDSGEASGHNNER